MNTHLKVKRLLNYDHLLFMVYLFIILNIPKNKQISNH